VINRLKLVIRVLALLACVFFSVPAWAQRWNVGYVFVAIGGGHYQVFDNNGNLIETISDGLGGQTAGCAFDSIFDLYGTDFTNSKVAVFDGTSTANPDPVTTFSVGQQTSGSPVTTDVHPESITFDSSGNFYVGFADQQTIVSGRPQIVPGGKLEKYNAANAFVQFFSTMPENRGVDWTDLESDQRTILYTSEGHNILAFDTVTNAQLPNFATGILTSSTDQLFAIKLLPVFNQQNPTDLNLFDGTGGVLVADTTDIKRFDGTGHLAKTYSLAHFSNWVALALDPNGTSFWAGDAKTGKIVRFNINTGAVEVGPTKTAAANGALNGICVKGGHQQNIVPLVYSAGSKVQRFAAFGAPGTNNYHTWTATVDTVNSPYVVAVSATEGVDPHRFDEYFCGQAVLGNSFGCSSGFTPATLTPITYADQVNASGNAIAGKAVVYRVENPPPTSDYSGSILFAVAFHPPAIPTSYSGLSCTVNGTLVQTNNPRLFRDPSAPDPVTGFPTDAASNHSFAYDYTIFANPFGKFGDPVYGRGSNYNDYLAADRCPSVAGAMATFNSPFPITKPVQPGSVVPIKITVTNASGNPVTDAVTFPNDITISVAAPDGTIVKELFNPGNSPSFFVAAGNGTYKGNLDTTGLASNSTYQVCVTSIDKNGTDALTNGGGGPGEFTPSCAALPIGQ